jgi:hypothetical protein
VETKTERSEIVKKRSFNITINQKKDTRTQLCVCPNRPSSSSRKNTRGRNRSVERSTNRLGNHT